VKTVSVSELQFFPQRSEKREIENKNEERVVIASLGNPVPHQSSSETAPMVMKNPSLSENEIISVQPRYSKNPKPLYPQEARKKGYEGEVLLKVEVLSDGRVGEVEVRRSSGHDILDRSAMAAVKRWKFLPAKKGETAVPVWVNIPVIFEIR
jgi:protein TonB